MSGNDSKKGDLMSGESEKPVHRWPLITLTTNETSAIAASGTKRKIVSVQDAGSPAEAARDAAIAVCRELGKERCLVEGVDGADVYEMVVDVNKGTLSEHSYSNPLSNHSGSTRTGGGHKLRATGKSRWTKRKLGIAATIGICVLTGGLLIGNEVLTDGGNEQQAIAPGAAQLPVEAPAGWSTYANWAVGSASGVPVVENSQGQLMLIEDSSLVTRDPVTGLELKRTAVPISSPNAVSAFYEGGIPRIAVASSGGELAVMDESDTQFSSVEVPEGFQAHLDRGEPLLLGRDQLAGVLKGNTVQRRIVPAGAEAISSQDGAIIAANDGNGRVWKITTDDPELPEPAEVPVPKGHAVKAIPAGALSRIAVIHENDDNEAQLSIFEVTAGQGETQMTELASKNLERNVGAGRPQWDRSAPLVSLGSTVIDFEDVSVVSFDERVVVGGGDIWASGSGTEKSARFSSSGTLLNQGESGASTPSLITGGGLAIVSEDGRTYALTDDPPEPEPSSRNHTSTPPTSPTPSNTN